MGSDSFFSFFINKFLSTSMFPSEENRCPENFF